MSEDVKRAFVADLARFEWDFTCEASGAGLFHDDDFVSDPDGVVGCWAAMTDLPSQRERPCYAYRVGKPGAKERPYAAVVPYADDRTSVGELEMANHRQQTCACTAAQRYMPSCPKHGIPTP